MSIYHHILLAVDFFGQNKILIERAEDLAQKNQARLSLIHVVDIMPVSDPAYEIMLPIDLDLRDEYIKSAKSKLDELAKKIKVANVQVYLETGSPKQEIVRLAQEIPADLIIIGSHGRHGLALLLGSTANGVLHHATCDVLAVRLPDN